MTRHESWRIILRWFLLVVGGMLALGAVVAVLSYTYYHVSSP